MISSTILSTQHTILHLLLSRKQVANDLYLILFRNEVEFEFTRTYKSDKNDTVGGYNCCDYDADYDWYGPEYFFPPQCVRQTSWTIPKRGSPIVAVVANATNPDPISKNIEEYFVALKKMQRNTAAWLVVPAYRTQYFASKEELFDYVASPDYLKDFDHQGICFGVEVLNDKDDDYAVNFYFNDQAFLASRLAYGIPSQQNPSYVPYNNAPDLPSYWKYRDRGYNLL